MPLQIVRNDITKMPVDAIVNAAKNSLAGGGGVDGCIHRAAGPGLLEECLTLGGCATGDAKITGAYNLPCRYVIHTVGPVYRDGMHGEQDALRSCYLRSLELAKQYKCETVAFPLISAGVFGYPKAQAVQVATSAIREFLEDNDMLVYLVVFGRSSLEISQQLLGDVRQYIDDHYTEARMFRSRSRLLEECDFLAASRSAEDRNFPVARRVRQARAPLDNMPYNAFEVDEGFSQMLLRKIDEKGMTDVQCYKKANIDRKLFSKIRSDPHYTPKKPTVIAFAVALELNLSETKTLLEAAGYALSHSYMFDVIVEYFIIHHNYRLDEINQVLYEYDQCLLGA